MRFLFFSLILMMPLSLLAQLTAPGSNAVRYTSYPTSPGVNDPVFIYCNPAGTQKGSLNAVSPGGTGPFTFSWYKWNDVTKSFSILLKTEPGVMSSSSDNLDEGGYRVNISDGFGYSTSLTSWIFLDKPYSSASLQNRTCDYVALRGGAAIDTFFYKDPSNGVPVKLPNGVRFLWSSDPQSTIPYPDIVINPQTFNPPLVDVTYQLQVTDSFTCSSQASFYYESIHVKSDFTADPVTGEAPLEVALTNNSIRGFIFSWEFGDDSISDMETPVPHIYYRPGEYYVKLTIESELHCTDVSDSVKIKVDESLIDIPNVFTPDGDGYNDWFMVESKSLRFISMEVFSRSGLKVYGFYGEGEKLKDWTGWDGNINNSSIKASPGVYFYIIRAIGWDDVLYDSKKYRGFVYLYR